MLNNRKFDKKEIDKICKNLTVVVDSREKANGHILEYFDKHKIKYKVDKLDYGDYSVCVDPMQEYGITHALDFRDSVLIERKSGWNELYGNIVTNRARFCQELAMCKVKMPIYVEQSWDDLYDGNYRSKYSPNAFLASLYTFEHRYGVVFKSIPKERMGKQIFVYLYYYLRERLK